MKRIIVIPLLLALVLTGCSVPADSTVSTEPVTEIETASELQTEPKSETQTEEVTESLTETEAETIPDTEMETDVPAALTDVQKTAYTYIRDELIPLYGISDLQSYPSICWDYSAPEVGALAPPAETQGIISAVTADMTGDAIPELLTVRSDGLDYVLEWYSIDGETVTLLDDYSISGGGATAFVTPKISLKNGRVIVYTEYLILPGCSRYGNETIVLGIEEGAVSELCSMGGSRSPGSVGFHVKGLGDLSFSLSESDDGEHPDVEKKAMDELEFAGVEAASIYAGWGWKAPDGLGGDLSYGIYPTFVEATLLFDTADSTPDAAESRQFSDHTDLRGYLALLDGAE